MRVERHPAHSEPVHKSMSARGRAQWALQVEAQDGGCRPLAHHFTNRAAPTPCDVDFRFLDGNIGRDRFLSAH